MRRSGARASGAETVLLLALIAWGLFPLALLVIHALGASERLTGADGLIGAGGVLGADQLQYLAWARDAGAHGLASNLFSLSPSGHVYLEPLFLITGLLGRIGVSLPIAYWIWKPIAAVALFTAALGWANRTMGEDFRARAAVVALSLFLYTPLAALYDWISVGSRPVRFNLYLLGDELLPASKLWGYAPSALGLALAVAALLAIDRALGSGSEAIRRGPGVRATSGARPAGSSAIGAAVLSALAATGATLLHPWLGPTLIVIFAGLTAWRRGAGVVPLALPALGAALALGYYYALSHGDPAWRLASHNEVIPRLPASVLLLGLGPLALLGAAGLRRPGGAPIEQILLLWILGSFVTYFANDAFAPHALQGLSLPLAVLIVRAAGRLRLPAVVGALGVAVLSVPGLAYEGRKIARVAASDNVQYYLNRGEARALAFVSAHAPAGGVLAPTPFAVVVPGATGRAVWVGHSYWSRGYEDRARRVDHLFDHRLNPADARAFVRSTGAALLIADCRHPISLNHLLGPLVASVRRFGCARVYILAGRSRSR